MGVGNILEGIVIPSYAPPELATPALAPPGVVKPEPSPSPSPSPEPLPPDVEAAYRAEFPPELPRIVIPPELPGIVKPAIVIPSWEEEFGEHRPELATPALAPPGVVKPEPSPSPEPPRPEPVKPEPEEEDEKRPARTFEAARSPEPEHYEGWEYAGTEADLAQEEADMDALMRDMPKLEPEYDEEDRKLFRSLLMKSGPGSNYLNPINLTGVPLHQQSRHRTALMAHSVPQRPMFEAEDVNVTDLVHRFQSMEMPSRAHMVRAASHIRGHIMENMWEDVNMGQRRARERHGRRGPFAKRRGRSRVMSKTANVQGRSRGKLYETTIRRKVTPYELELVMKKLRLHLESGVGSVLFMHFGRTRQLIGDLTDIDLEDLKRRIRKKLERHPVVGIELADARVGGALHHPRTHSAQFTRTLL